MDYETGLFERDSPRWPRQQGAPRHRVPRGGAADRSGLDFHPMDEVIDGVWHWTRKHEHIGAEVSSYYVEAIGTVFDPMEREEGFGFFDGRPVERIVLSNGHHTRHAQRFADHFGVP